MQSYFDCISVVAFSCRVCLQAGVETASDTKTQYATKTKKRQHVMLHCQFQHGFSSETDSTSDAALKQKFLLCFPGETPCRPDSNRAAAKALGSERRNWLLKKKRIADELQSGRMFLTFHKFIIVMSIHYCYFDKM